VLEKEVALLEGTKRSQVIESKHKEVATGDEEGQRLFKKAKGRQQGKYYRGAAVKIESTNLCKRCVSVGQNCLVHYSR